MLPVSDQVPIDGSYNSADDRKPVPFPLIPPATNTLPLGRSVAVCSERGVLILPVVNHTPRFAVITKEVNFDVVVPGVLMISVFGVLLERSKKMLSTIIIIANVAAITSDPFFPRLVALLEPFPGECPTGVPLPELDAGVPVVVVNCGRV
jgi:hypothetical protein